EVVFVTGRVTAAGHPIALGARVGEGQELLTGADGYLYLRTADQGVFILRPNSRATIERYAYDPSRPEGTQVKVVLSQGVMRGISGLGVKAAREQFRFNTPVAAIGVRGTDFSVFTSSEVSRASVRSGGIVMAGFGPSCPMGGGGPCSGEGAEELYATQKDVALLQLQRGDPRPQRLDARYLHLAPDSVVPPNGQEPGTGAASASPSNTGTVRSESALISNAVTAPPPVIEEPRHIQWGRWTPLVGLPANVDVEALPAGLETIVKFPTFGLWQDAPLTGTLPREGRGEFTLRDHEGYFVAGDRMLESARAENARLTVDFGTRSFETRMDLIGTNYRTDIVATGSVDTDGRLASNLIGSNSYIRGTLTGENGKQAGYLYQRTVSGSLKAIGATFWSR
ncbi:MAG: FecR domain-containing protein, partial [Rhodocyclaceae bacterium]|nr:FecR domain-containing protein [Rhodocyclaceae bacterium]